MGHKLGIKVGMDNQRGGEGDPPGGPNPWWHIWAGAESGHKMRHWMKA